MPPGRPRHRKVRTPPPGQPQAQRDRLGYVLVALAAALVVTVSLLGGMATYASLRHFAGAQGGPQALGTWWPVLVYGPWLVASLCIIRAALYHRRAPHSWSVVLMFSAFAFVLCVAQAPRTATGATTAGLPAVAALVCLHQLVRQITLTRPPRRRAAAPRS